MDRTRRWRGTGAYGWLTAVVLLASIATSAERAGGEGMLTILSAEHDPRGRILASVTPSDPGVELTQLSALVDGVPRRAEVTRQPSLPANVVVAIDTSGSMAGEPIVAARDAATALVQRLGPNDQVAVVAFADFPVVLSGFEAGRQSAIDQIAFLQAGGNTALFGAIDQSLLLLGESGGSGVRAVVLLSDGRDSGESGAVENSEQRAASLASIGASGVSVYTFAVGMDADLNFLEQAAAQSAGDFWQVSEGDALGELFMHLGTSLGSSTEVTVTVPPLSRGAHTLELRGVAGGEPVTGTLALDVSNDGLIAAQPRVQDGPSDGRPMVIDLAVAAPAGSLRYRATADGQPVTVLDHPVRVALDPWRFAPGPVVVHVEALVDEAVVSSTKVAVDVPALAPQLTVEVIESGGTREAVVRGRVQDRPDARIEVAVDSTVVGEGAGPEVRVPLPEAGGALVARLVSDGTEVATSAQAIGAQGANASTLSMPVMGALMAVLAAVALLSSQVVVRRGRRGPREEWRPNGQTMLVGRRVISTMEAHRPRGAVIVRRPGGDERRYEICRAPLTLGRDESCDIVIADRAVGPVHARLYALGGGEFRIHGIAPRGTTPFQSVPEDEWMVVRHGEQIAIGEHLLTILNVEERGQAVPA